MPMASRDSFSTIHKSILPPISKTHARTVTINTPAAHQKIYTRKIDRGRLADQSHSLNVIVTAHLSQYQNKENTQSLSQIFSTAP